MPGSQYAGMCLVRIDGRPIPSDVELLLAGATVDSSVTLPGAFLLRFRDPDRVVLAKANIKLAADVEILFETADPGAPASLLRGEVTALEAELDGEGTFTVVRGYERTHRLHGRSHTDAFQNMSYDQIVTSVLRRAGLQAGRISPTGAVHAHVPQGGLDDWTFLNALADRIGFQLTSSDGKVHFGPPVQPSRAPATSTSANPYVLQPGEDLLSLRAVVSGTGQAATVSVRAWDRVTKKPLNAKRPATSAQALLDKASTADRVGQLFGGGECLNTAEVHSQQSTVQRSAEATAARAAAGFAELDGVLRGEPKLLAGCPVRLAGLGEPFDGQYTLTRARHVFDPELGYTTAISVSRAPGATARGGAAATDNRTQGIAPAVVTDVRDPLKLGRVKVKLPWLADDYESDWAPTMQLGAGPARGSFVLPEVMDQVLVAFERGDLGNPYVLGGLHSNADKPPNTPEAVGGSGQVTRRAFVSRDGHALQFVDNGGSKRGTSLHTGDSKMRLDMEVAATRISVTSEGTVVIDARNGIRLNSVQGPVELSGTRIKLDASAGIDVNAGASLKMAARAGLDLSGATASLRGNATAELKAGGQCTVNGAIVRIN